MHPEVFVAAPGRSGSTMLTWLLHLHGYHIGEGRVTQAPETNPQVPTENTRAKEILRHQRGGIGDSLRALYADRGPWVLKTAQILKRWRNLHQEFPEAKWLLLHRPLRDIVNSRLRHPGMRGDERFHRSVASEQQSRQSEIKAELGPELCMMPSADELCGRFGVERGWDHFARVAEFLDFTPDVNLYSEWVQPERWHAGENNG